MNFSPAQLEFLSQIKDYIIANAYLASNDLQGFNDACGTQTAFLSPKRFLENTSRPCMMS